MRASLRPALLLPLFALLLALPSHSPRATAPRSAPDPIWLSPEDAGAAGPSPAGGVAVERKLEERVRQAWLERQEESRVTLEGHRIEPSAQTMAMLEAAGVFAQRGAARETASGSTIRRARLQKQGRPVFNRPILLEERDGQLVRQKGRAFVAPFDLKTPIIGSDAALERALAHLASEELRGLPRVERGWLASAGETLPAYRVVAPSMRPFGSFQIDVDARSGRVIAMVDLVRAVDGQGRVHDPNPIDDPGASVVTLTDLDGSGALGGSFTRVFDVVDTEAFVPGLAFLFDPGDSRFVQTSVYRGLTDAGHLAVAHGFPAFPNPILAFTNLRDPGDGVSEFNNAFYDPFFQVFGFGNGDGTLTANLGTDLDVAAHEMAHHIFQELVDPEFQALEDSVLAINEGVADTWAALLTDDPEIGESTIPGNPFLRNVDNAASFLDPFNPDPHIEGLIFAGANWDIVELIGSGAFTDVLLDALARLPSDATPVDYQTAILEANLAVRAGADQAAIAAVFAARAFDETELPDDFEGFLSAGVTESRFLADSPQNPANWNVDLWGFSEYPGSARVRFTTTGSGDVDLFVAALDPTVVPTAFSGSVGTSNEVIELTPGSNLSVDADDSWFVVVNDFPDGSSSSYQITASIALQPADLTLGGSALSGSLDEVGEIDFYLFQTNQPGKVVRARVEATGRLDPQLVVFDPFSIEVFDGDDDSGPGTDAFLEGVRLPAAGFYAVAVLSFAGDIDDETALGGYRVSVESCNNSAGGNTDGDALVDACDPDDDDDGFRDPSDIAPLDATLCADQDEDGCDDCSSGSFDPFFDGADADGDALCDTGDLDDDNDGCIDEDDPEPLLASADGDFDFLGDDCDNCRDAANPDQADFDAGADDDTSLPGIQHYGDACDADLDDDGVVGPSDFFGAFRPCIGADLATVPVCAEADFDGDGVVAPADFFSGLRPALGTAPGPGVTE